MHEGDRGGNQNKRTKIQVMVLLRERRKQQFLTSHASFPASFGDSDVKPARMTKSMPP